MHRAYLGWAPANALSIHLSYIYQQEDGEIIPPEKLTTQKVPAEFNFYIDQNWFCAARVSYVEQEYFDSLTTQNEHFVITDASIGYRFSSRRGFLKFSINNATEEKFNYYDTNIRSLSRDPHIPEYIPERQYNIQLTYRF